MKNEQKTAADAAPTPRIPWYAARGDTVIYLLVAVLLVEMIVGGVCFFYGLMNAKPAIAGGPPIVNFPWLVWAAASVLAPVALLLMVHLTGIWIARTLDREAREEGSGGAPGAPIPERLQRFYAMVNTAPTVVLLLGILLLGASLFFVEGAFTAIMGLLTGLSVYVPWIAGSLATLLAVCYLAHRYFAYRRLRMEHEFAFRQEVLERTGIVLVDKHTIPLPQNEAQRAMIGSLENPQQALPPIPPVLDTETRPLPPSDNDDSAAPQDTPNGADAPTTPDARNL